jgi:small subunit ribosomal protein S11
MKQKVVKKKGRRRQLPLCRVNISSTFSNTIVTLTDIKGNVLVQESGGGGRRFTGTKKGTALASKLATESLIKRGQNLYGFKEAIVLFKGIGSGKDVAIKTLNENNIKILNIINSMHFPHNGCKAPKNSRFDR